MWQKNPKKTIYTLNIDNHAPQVTAITFPFLQRYADKIGADIHIIKERKFPEWPITYEKFQIYELAQQMGNDWNIYIDSDALIHPDTPDFTLLLPRDTVSHHGSDFAPLRWKYDRFFQRDGRHIGSGNWFTLASDLCIELWRPIDDLTVEEALASIQPTVEEQLSGVIETHHLIDDFNCSRNIAKFGLKFIAIRKLMEQYGYEDGGYFFYHAYTIAPSLKASEMRKVLKSWGYREDDSHVSPPVVKAEKIDGAMGREDLEWLHDTAKRMASVVEVGCWKGRSTYALLAGCLGPVYAVDHWEGATLQEAAAVKAGVKPFEDFMRNVGKFKNLVVVKMSSDEAANSELVPAQIDMVFLDAEHEYEAVIRDLRLWAPKTRKLICGHDWAFASVRKAVNEFFGPDKVITGPGDIWQVKMEAIQ
jgi:hypothetical protein